MSLLYRNTQISFGVYLRLMLYLIIFLTIFVGIKYILEPVVSETPIVPIESVRATSAKEIVYGDQTKKQVIFTFDGGSGTQSTESILNTLAKHKVKGTFFLTGKFIESNPGVTRKIVAGGHEIFNHTYSHPHLPSLTSEDIDLEFSKTEKILRKVAGVSTAPYFRAPFGDRDERVLRDAFKSGYQSVYWSVDAGDWRESEGMTADMVRETILSNLYPGAIYLMHLGDNITGEILDDIFFTIKSRGYEIVSLSQGI